MNLILLSKTSLVIAICYMLIIMFMIVGIITGDERAIIGLEIVCVMWVTFQIINTGMLSLRALSVKRKLEKQGIVFGTEADIVNLINSHLKSEKKKDDE